MPQVRATPDEAGQPARILIVDDERQNRELLEAMLAPEGFDLLLAARGEEACALVLQQPPDLILLDAMMPGMDGYHVAARVKGNPCTSHIPIIMISALDDRATRMRGLNAGAEDFLTKPIDRAELCVRMRNLLRLKAYGDAAAAGILHTGLDAQWLSVNERLCTLMGYSRADLQRAAQHFISVLEDGRKPRALHAHVLAYSRQQLSHAARRTR
jgi:DNA-binding response OmpR family regulator